MRTLIHTMRLMLAVLLLATVPTASVAQPQRNVERPFFLTFSSPVYLTHSGDGTDRIFVVEQDGIVKVFPNDSTVMSSDVRLFLDLRTHVTRFHNEAGLLGLAFHPDYATNGYFYLYYTRSDPDRSVVSRFQVDPTDADRADPASEFVLLEISQPFGNHNAGMMQFGPRDGYLYISVGDGGDRRSGELFPPDSEQNGQNVHSLLGTILRIDVDGASDETPYGIPPDNPFANDPEAGREEIWSYGLRNPWRFSIDSLTNQLWVADVGAKAWEEINLVEGGDNFGWSVMEGASCFETAECEAEGMKPPLVQHANEGGCSSITGGYVYRGARRPERQGAYIYGDWCNGNVRMLRFQDGVVEGPELLFDTAFRISSFGVDEQGELYIVDHQGGIFRFTRSSSPTTAESPVETPRHVLLEQNFPNPFTLSTEIWYTVDQRSDVELKVYDLLGREVRRLASGPHASGAYAVEWDGADDSGRSVAGGAYLYVLKGGGRSETRIMNLLR